MNKAYVGFKKVMKNLDAFGSPISFNIDGKSTYQSVMGGFMTLLMVAFVILFFQSQIRNFFNRTKIYVDKSQTFSSDPPLVVLDSNNFMFAVAVEQPSEYAFSERPFFTVEMNQSYYDRSGEKEVRKTITIPLEPCTVQRFKLFGSGQSEQTIEDIYNKFNFQNYLCPQQRFKIELKGSFLNTDFRFVTLNIKKCVPNTEDLEWNYTCAPQKVIDKYLAQNGAFRFNLYTTNYVINSDKSVDFSQLYLAEDLNFLFQPDYSLKSVNIFFRENVVQTDNSLFVTSTNDTDKFIFRGENSVTQEAVQDLTKPEDQIVDSLLLKKKPSLKVYLRSDYFTLKATRRFMKIDELLSYFGGIFQLFILLIGLFMKFYNEKFFMLRLANKIYDFKEFKQHYFKKYPDEQAQKVNLLLSKKNTVADKYGVNKQDQAELSDVTDLKKIKELGFSGRKEFLMWYFEKILSQKLKMKASCSYIIFQLTCKKLLANNRNKLIDKAIFQATKDMNIKNMMDQLSQIDKLKRLILNPNQIILFNFFPKPEISLRQERIFNINTLQSDVSDSEAPQDNKKKRVSKTTNIRTNEITTRLDYKSFAQLLQSFDQIVKTESSDETTQLINNKLIYLLGKEIRTIFKTSLMIQGLEKESAELEFKSGIRDKMEIELKEEDDELKMIKSKYMKTQKPMDQSILLQQQNQLQKE